MLKDSETKINKLFGIPASPGIATGKCILETNNLSYFVETLRAKPVAPASTLRASLDALRASSHSPTGIARGTLPFGLLDNISGSCILVVKYSQPIWATFLPYFVGLITENGGKTCHLATISREMGIPAVVGIENVTNILKTGDLAQLEGTIGEITIERR